MSETTNLKLFKHDNPPTNENQFDIEKALNQNWNKIDDYAGETNKKLNTLEEDNTQNKADISNIKEEQTAQNEELEALRSALPSETQEGESINIKGTIPTRFKKFVVKGNSKQETREGYNLLNYNSIESTTINGVTFTINEDKSITANGTATANATFNLVRRTWKLSA